MSLARGLDYYTGIIYEAIVAASAPPGFNSANVGESQPVTNGEPALHKKKKPKKPKSDTVDEEEEIDESQVGVGSIAAGGRYDNLVSVFTTAAAGEGKKGASLPCIGVSIGLDRIFAIVWPKWEDKGMRSKETMAYVMAAGDGLLEERIRLVQELREAGVKVCPYLSWSGGGDVYSLHVFRRISLLKRNPSYRLSLPPRRKMKSHLTLSLELTS